MDKRLISVLFEYFNKVGGPQTWDSLTRRPAEWLKIEFKNKFYFIFLKIELKIKKIYS